MINKPLACTTDCRWSINSPPRIDFIQKENGFSLLFLRGRFIAANLFQYGKSDTWFHCNVPNHRISSSAKIPVLWMWVHNNAALCGFTLGDDFKKAAVWIIILIIMTFFSAYHLSKHTGTKYKKRYKKKQTTINWNKPIKSCASTKTQPVIQSYLFDSFFFNLTDGKSVQPCENVETLKNF